jgi:hypothetical protein
MTDTTVTPTPPAHTDAELVQGLNDHMWFCAPENMALSTFPWLAADAIERLTREVGAARANAEAIEAERRRLASYVEGHDKMSERIYVLGEKLATAERERDEARANSQWHAIGTAPKGIDILVGWWMESGEGWFWFADSVSEPDYYPEATHWRHVNPPERALAPREGGGDE